MEPFPAPFQPWSDDDAFAIHVEDTIFGVLHPEYQVTNSSSSLTLTACARIHYDTGVNPLSYCDDELAPGIGETECCKTVGPGATVAFGVEVIGDTPGIVDATGTYTLTILSDASSDLLCEPYSFQYRF